MIYYEIEWVCTLTGVKGKEYCKYYDYKFATIVMSLYDKFYGDLFKHKIIKLTFGSPRKG
jgi:hypothetical protein